MKIFDSECINIYVSKNVSTCARSCYGCNKKKGELDFIGFDKLFLLDSYIKNNFKSIKSMVFTVDFFQNFDIIRKFLSEKQEKEGLTYLFMSDIENFYDFDKNVLISFFEKNNDYVSVLLTINLDEGKEKIILKSKKLIEFINLTKKNNYIFLDILGGENLTLKEKEFYFEYFLKIHEICKQNHFNLDISKGAKGGNYIQETGFEGFFRPYFYNCHILEEIYPLEIAENKICFHGQLCNYININNFGTIYDNKEDIERKAEEFKKMLVKYHGLKGDKIGGDSCLKCMEYFGIEEKKYKNFLPNNFLHHE